LAAKLFPGGLTGAREARQNPLQTGLQSTSTRPFRAIFGAQCSANIATKSPRSYIR
jgi:hypothetical protein